MRQNIKLRADFLHTAGRRAAVGYTSQLELKQAQAEYQATAALEPAAALAVAQEEDGLSALIGQSPRAVIRAAGGLDTLTVPAVPGGLPSSLLRRRPDVFAAQEAVIAADHSLSSARAAMLPDFALTGDVGEEFAQVLAHGEVEYLIANSVVGPLFDSGRRRAAADAVAAQRNQAAYAYKGVVLGALRDVDDSLIAIQRDREQNAVLATQVEVEGATLHVASERYRAGYTPYFDQIDSERQLLAAQLSLAQARTAWLTAYVNLYEALGGGWRWQDAQAAEPRR
ncbi:MAG: TolC family protein [Caulobacteraceae bacterium]